jgi:hypothetical protein
VGGDALLEETAQEGEVDLAADERAAMIPGDVDPEAGPRGRRMEDPDRLGLALERRRRQLVVGEDTLRRLVCGEPHRDAHLGRHRLDPGRRVDGVPGQEPLARAGRDPEPDEDLAGVDPDPQAELRPAKRSEPGGVLADPKGRPDRTLRVVLVGGGHAEDPQHRVADELLDHAAVGLDLRAGHREVRGQHAVDVLGIGTI